MLALLIIWGFLLLYGLVYLLVDSELLEKPRKWFTSVVSSPEDAAIEALISGKVAESAPIEASPTFGKKIRVFIGRVLSCWMCSAGWMSIPAALMVFLFWVCLSENMHLAAGMLALPMLPPTGIGFVAMVDHFSPKRAAESVVNAMTDIAQVVLSEKKND